MHKYRKFKKKYRGLHIILIAVAIVMFWRGIWGLLDTYLFPENEFLSYLVSTVLAFLILFLDDFHLKELE